MIRGLGHFLAGLLGSPVLTYKGNLGNDFRPQKFEVLCGSNCNHRWHQTITGCRRGTQQVVRWIEMIFSQRFLNKLVFLLVFGLMPGLENLLWGQGFAPAEAAAKMTVTDGLAVKLFASEPEVRQPIFVKMDDRGRLWTIQYLQYPNPAGLKRVETDRWSRTVYDRLPQPPPLGPRGADKITILEDRDGDGQADHFKDFVTGLNLTTGVEFGHGGVYVIQVPYLLFYPDRNRDDVPDSDPEVLLTGFGMEDAQSFANHLTWGPDGWLYGVNGSTTTCQIRGIEFQQGCWRYHPLSKEFELFCEGGGNLYGLTFDEQGKLFYSSNGGLFYHAVQGGYYQKTFNKHGPLHNLYTYGHLRHVKNPGVRGTPTTGGTIYLGDTFPPQYRGAFLCGNFLGHSGSWWHVQPRQSTVEASFAGLLFDSHDTWFGPTDLCLGAGGSIYVSDFHDRRTAHPDPDADWDRSNGRIFKIEASGVKPLSAFDLSQQSNEELIDLLDQSNRWFSQRARSELAHRRDPSVIPRLQKMALQNDNPQRALEALWALHVTAPLEESVVRRLLGHPYDEVRCWTVRLLGDTRRVSPGISREFVRLAGVDASVQVRQQLAASARRLPSRDALPILQQLLRRDEDAQDLRLPLLLWWALESKAMSHADDVVDLFAHRQAWEHPLNVDCALKLIRRYAADGSVVGYAACLRLLEAMPPTLTPSAHQALTRGLAEREVGLTGLGKGGLFLQQGSASEAELSIARRKFSAVTPALKKYIARYWNEDQSNLLWLNMAVRCRVDGAYSYLKKAVTQPLSDAEVRLQQIELLARFGRLDCVPQLLSFAIDHELHKVRSAALAALERFDDANIGPQLLAHYPSMPAEIQTRTRGLLFSRLPTTKAFLDLVDQGKVDPQQVPITELRQITVHGEESLNQRVQKHWGKITAGTPEEKLAAMRRFNNDLRAGTGDRQRGRQLFEKNCANCHQLFGRGAKIGPDLTSTTRQDTAALLANLVDPSAVIRRNYLTSIIVTTSGRLLSGLIIQRDAAKLTMANAKGELTTIPGAEIEEIRTSPVSLMPENQLDNLTPQERRDLFQYLQSEEP